MEFDYKAIHWKIYQGALIADVPPHTKIELDKNDISFLLKKSKAFFLRWVSDFDRKDKTQFWYVIKDNFGDFDELSSNTRSKIRRGLKKCYVKKVDKKEIADQGYNVYIKAFDRYDTFIKPLSEEEFKKNIEQTDYDYWAVYFKENDELVAFSQNIIADLTVNYSVIKLHPDYLKYYTSYALLFEMNKYYLSEHNFKYVNDGARSLSHATNIQNFLIEKFKFRKAYCTLNVAYSPLVEIFVKILYPFRKIIEKLKFSIAQKITVVLRHEEIRRSFIKKD